MNGRFIILHHSQRIVTSVVSWHKAALLQVRQNLIIEIARFLSLSSGKINVRLQVLIFGQSLHGPIHIAHHIIQSLNGWPATVLV